MYMMQPMEMLVMLDNALRMVKMEQHFHLKQEMDEYLNQLLDQADLESAVAAVRVSGDGNFAFEEIWPDSIGCGEKQILLVLLGFIMGADISGNTVSDVDGFVRHLLFENPGSANLIWR